MDRKTLVHIGLLVLGAVLGLALAESVGQVVWLRTGLNDLNTYALRLQKTAVQVDRQTENAVNTVLGDHLPFCSPQELMLMRRLVYQSSEVKDIGRIRDNKLVCAGALGLLPDPFVIAPPDISFRNMSVTARTPILIGGQANGFVIQVRDVNMVLNPDAFAELSDPPRTYGAYLYDNRTRSLIQGFGDTVPLSKDEVIAGEIIERKGIYYRPLCAPESRVCVVAAESTRSMMSRSQPLRGVLLFAGASAGDTLVLALVLFYQRHRSQRRQLLRAVRRGDLHLVYQPIVDLSTHRIVGAEALLRWTNEQGEPVSPETFIPIAEHNGFITDITRHVVSCALQELGVLLGAGDLRLTVNITAQDLADPEFFPFLQSELKRFGVLPSSFGLELTERSTTDQQAAIAAIAQLRQAGYTVYIDDFGTGYSSLAYLRDLAVDVIKIDRAFTATVGTNAITESIIPQILHIAGQLRLSVVVEGIETAEQAAYFRSTGSAIFGQGWFFSRPLSAQSLRDLIQSPLLLSAHHQSVKPPFTTNVCSSAQIA